MITLLGYRATMGACCWMAELVETGRGLALKLEDVPAARVAVDLTLDAVGAPDDKGHDQQCSLPEARRCQVWGFACPKPLGSPVPRL
ncbi:MAG: hypothetical protein EA346_01395 [Thioalkalivibrio sp.]|nr:MAG: hypothetical protein EA346_01395 [Thioalkalivibrio sp.]